MLVGHVTVADCFRLVLLLSKWVHCLESSDIPPSSAEAEIITQIKSALEGMYIEYNENGSLASAIVKRWAPLMLDVRRTNHVV